VPGRRTAARYVFHALARVALLCALGIAGLAAAETPAIRSLGSAPDFSRPDLDNQVVRLSDYRGKVVLLNFWATWCSPCLGEIPRFAEWQRIYGRRGLQVVGVSMDDEEEPVRAAYRKYGLTYPVVMGDAKLGQLYGGILGLPVTLLIGADGEIRFRHKGASDLDAIEREIRQLLPRR
jgi:peroxiredoxin